MIAFRCTHCGLHMQVQDQYAGQRTHCPSCKYVDAVPFPATLTWHVPRQIEGHGSSLARAGIAGGVTLAMSTSAKK
jgi:hypothetical protein